MATLTFWSVLAQGARLLLEYAERQTREERPIVDVIKEAWGTSQRTRE